MSGEWVEIIATGPDEGREAAIGFFTLSGCTGVIDGGFTRPRGELLVSVSSWCEPVDIGTGETKPGNKATLTGYLPAGSDVDVEQLKKRLKGIGWRAAVSGYDDVDWSSKWRRGLRPVRMTYRGRTLVVRPTWSRARTRPGDVTVELDPGMAFGTGSHPTTSMCLRAVLRILTSMVDAASATVLDVGCGSGVIAIAARLLGARRAVATDIDPMAVEATRANSRANGAGVRATDSPLDEVPGRFTLVVANILSGELKKLAPELYAHTAPGGRLVLSGILDAEAAELAEYFEAAGLTLERRYSTGGWTALVMARPKG